MALETKSGGGTLPATWPLRLRAVREYLRVTGASELDCSKFEVIEDLRTPGASDFYDVENERLLRPERIRACKTRPTLLTMVDTACGKTHVPDTGRVSTHAFRALAVDAPTRLVGDHVYVEATVGDTHL